MAVDLLHIDGELADRLAGVEQIQDAVTRRDVAYARHRIDQPPCGHVRDGDQFGARTDYVFERGEVDLSGVVVVHHVDLDFQLLHGRFEGADDLFEFGKSVLEGEGADVGGVEGFVDNAVSRAHQGVNGRGLREARVS